MSKRNSLGNTSATNTLFKYFTKSPATPKTPQQNLNASTTEKTTPKSSSIKGKSIDSTSRPIDKKVDDDDDESQIRSVKPKRLKLIDSDSESDRENEVPSIDSKKKFTRPATSEPSTPQPKKKMKREPKDSYSFEEKLKNIVAQDINDVEELLDDEPMLWMHNKLDFLKPENVKDADGRKPDHAEYNPNTLFVPKTYLDKLTPVRRFD